YKTVKTASAEKTKISKYYFKS
ncbi:hypothetical protein Q604_UNBC00787G0001, partial [human gut metagenome]